MDEHVRHAYADASEVAAESLLNLGSSGRGGGRGAGEDGRTRGCSAAASGRGGGGLCVGVRRSRQRRRAPLPGLRRLAHPARDEVAAALRHWEDELLLRPRAAAHAGRRSRSDARRGAGAATAAAAPAAAARCACAFAHERSGAARDSGVRQQHRMRRGGGVGFGHADEAVLVPARSACVRYPRSCGTHPAARRRCVGPPVCADNLALAWAARASVSSSTTMSRRAPLLLAAAVLLACSVQAQAQLLPLMRAAHWLQTTLLEVRARRRRPRHVPVALRSSVGDVAPTALARGSPLPAARRSRCAPTAPAPACPPAAVSQSSSPPCARTRSPPSAWLTSPPPSGGATSPVRTSPAPTHCARRQVAGKHFSRAAEAATPHGPRLR